jgi:hypothetical protein
MGGLCNSSSQLRLLLQSSCDAGTQVYKYRDTHAGGVLRVEVYVSFGGLLMLLAGDPKKLSELEVDATIYLLVRKV